jgi:CRP/FNR family cyclic AMP-dependent transcriptional regulator
VADNAGKIASLQTSELFRRFDRKQLEGLADITDELRLDKGAVLCEQGRIANECWIVVEGEADVEIGDGRLVGVVGPGESVGEMGLLDHLPRSATVTARTPMVVLRVEASRFETLLGASPMARGLLETLSRRIRDLEHGRLLLH